MCLHSTHAALHSSHTQAAWLWGLAMRLGAEAGLYLSAQVKLRSETKCSQKL